MVGVFFVIIPRSTYKNNRQITMKSALFSLIGLLTTVAAGGVQVSTVSGRRECIVTANGNKVSDVENVLKAFDRCGKSGNIIFPEGENYWIDRKLNPHVNDVHIQWRGEWTVGKHHPARADVQHVDRMADICAATVL